MQGRISRIVGRILSGAIALEPVSVSVAMAPPPAQAQTYTILYRFTDGGGSLDLTSDAAGNLYGINGWGEGRAGMVYKLSPAGRETVLYSFKGGLDGGSPSAVIRDSDGNLYGTTNAGGSGYGVVFKLDPAGKETVLYSFKGGLDGGIPRSVVRDSAGNLYGTTIFSGRNSTGCGFNLGCGVVFKVDPAGKEVVLYSFTGDGDGGLPNAGLIRDREGNLYGTTASGGVATGVCPRIGCGVVFKLDPAGKETVLHSFTGGADGVAPEAGLIRDAEGNLYGVGSGGVMTGKCASQGGCGVVFKSSPAGKLTVLYSFQGGADGDRPSGALIRDSAGNLYGTTKIGGSSACNGGCGVVFKLSPAGNQTVLHTFAGPPKDGANPGPAALIRDSAGNLYGTCGLLVFKLKLQ